MPSPTAAKRSSVPKIFKNLIAPAGRFGDGATLNASGIANAPVMMSPQPAEYGNGPLRRPVAANNRNSTPSTRSALTPINNGMGIAIKVARILGYLNASAATVSNGTANSTPTSGTGWPGEKTNLPAAPSPVAKPTQAPAIAARLRR